MRRKQLGHTQAWLADQIEMDVTSLRGIECGRSCPKLPTLIKLVKVLETTFDALLADLVEDLPTETLD